MVIILLIPLVQATMPSASSQHRTAQSSCGRGLVGTSSEPLQDAGWEGCFFSRASVVPKLRRKCRINSEVRKTNHLFVVKDHSSSKHLPPPAIARECAAGRRRTTSVGCAHPTLLAKKCAESVAACPVTGPLKTRDMFCEPYKQQYWCFCCRASINKYGIKIKIHSRCETEYFVETHLCKLCMILRSRAL